MCTHTGFALRMQKSGMRFKKIILHIYIITIKTGFDVWTGSKSFFINERFTASNKDQKS